MTRNVGSVCFVLLASSLLALPAAGGKPGPAQRNSRRGFSGATNNSLPPAQAGARQRAFPDTRTGQWGRDWSAERRETIRSRNDQQRQDRADHLRGIGEHNGNARLGDTATRMEQRGHDRPVANDQPQPGPYDKIKIYAQDPALADTAAAPQPARKPSWTERLRSWRPWRR